jgi:Fe-S-cluster containining protein
MHCTRCGVCCQETDMMLSEEDISRLEQQGYSKESFVRFDPEGYALLRNRQGHCVFYNPKDKCCAVYSIRPAGCRVYPIMLDEDLGIVVDDICCARGSISDEEKRRRGERVIKLLAQIDYEARSRRSK